MADTAKHPKKDNEQGTEEIKKKRKRRPKKKTTIAPEKQAVDVLSTVKKEETETPKEQLLQSREIPKDTTTALEEHSVP
jgi:hypothetical protein